MRALLLASLIVVAAIASVRTWWLLWLDLRPLFQRKRSSPR